VEAVAADDEHEHPHRQAEFHAFFENHHRALSRFAYLLTGDHDAADDLTAEALTAAWSSWDRVRSAELPLAYVRRIVANLAADRVRKVVRERRGLAVLGQRAERSAPVPDVPAVVDLRTALMSLPSGKRACVVLRYAFDLSEGETARTLGISVGTVKSQTAKGVAELERILKRAEPPPTATTQQEVTPRMAPEHPETSHGGTTRPGASRLNGARSGSGESPGRRGAGQSDEPAGPAPSAFTLRHGTEPTAGAGLTTGPGLTAEAGLTAGAELTTGAELTRAAGPTPEAARHPGGEPLREAGRRPGAVSLTRLEPLRHEPVSWRGSAAAPGRQPLPRQERVPGPEHMPPTEHVTRLDETGRLERPRRAGSPAWPEALPWPRLAWPERLAWPVWRVGEA
jgi:RNA polymerase sigma-70 factor (sigma-E family)